MQLLTLQRHTLWKEKKLGHGFVGKPHLWQHIFYRQLNTPKEGFGYGSIVQSHSLPLLKMSLAYAGHIGNLHEITKYFVGVGLLPELIGGGGRWGVVSWDLRICKLTFTTEGVKFRGISCICVEVVGICAYRLSTVPMRSVSAILSLVYDTWVVVCSMIFVSYLLCNSWWYWISFWYISCI